MLITPQELKSVLYSYQVEQITDEDDEIVSEAIDTAEMLVRGYLDSANKRRETAGLTKQQYRAWKIYDIDAMFNPSVPEADQLVGSSPNVQSQPSMDGSTSPAKDPRNPLLMRIIKRIAAFNIIELSCPDVLSERITDIYNKTIELLQRIAGEGEYALSRYIIPDAVFVSAGADDTHPDASESDLDLPFRMVSRTKFRHEPL